MARLAEEALPIETGGVLVGWYSGTVLHVNDAIRVDDPNASPTSYQRTNPAGNEALTAHLEGKSDGDPSGYVGEWHSHPTAAGPSPLDRLSFLRIALLVDRPLAMVVLTRQGGEWIPVDQLLCPKRWPWKRPKGQS